MDMDRKIKEDFEFYSRFIYNFRQFPVKEDNYISEAWVHKLITENEYLTLSEQKNRNIYLANLVICIQKLKLEGPFTQYPPDYRLEPARNVFPPLSKEVVEPSWLESIVNYQIVGDCNFRSKDGRTYLATKSMEDGTGTMGYFAVSLGGGDLENWIQNQNNSDDKKKKIDTDVNEIEKLLMSRKNQKEREKMFDYYNWIQEEVKNELQGRSSNECNDEINGLLDELKVQLKYSQKWHHYCNLPEKKFRKELLTLLLDWLEDKKQKIIDRQEFLDKVEQSFLGDMISSLPIESHAETDSKEAYASKVWEQAINDGPKEKLLKMLTENYPNCLIKRFLFYLSYEKEKIAIGIQQRHENIVSQLKKELQKEHFRGKKKVIEAECALDEILCILKEFQEASAEAKELQQKRQSVLAECKKRKDEVYDEILNALDEAEQNVQAEAEIGKWLSDTIQGLTQQNERYQKINEDNIKKIEDANALVMRNIKKLKKAICLSERRLYNLNGVCTLNEARCDSF